MKRTSILFPLLLSALAGCSASSSSSAGKTNDETLSNPSDASDSCAPANNPDGCPAQYSHDDDGETCPGAGLECKYPGESDNYGACGDFALLQCVAQDGGALAWSAQQ